MLYKKCTTWDLNQSSMTYGLKLLPVSLICFPARMSAVVMDRLCGFQYYGEVVIATRIAIDLPCVIHVD